MTVHRTYGLKLTDTDEPKVSLKKKIQYINLKLAAGGYPTCESVEGKSNLLEVAAPLLSSYSIKSSLVGNSLSPVGTRVKNFLDHYLSDVEGGFSMEFPNNPFVLDRHGLARIVSLPPNADYYENGIIKTYRTVQGILNNPKEDRRTTKGVFHVVEGGAPIAHDKKAVSKVAFARLLKSALNPPAENMVLPFTANQETPAELFVSLMLRPIVVPEVPGVTAEKSMEITFLAPGSLVSNLDFVESIFGNAGEDTLPRHDAALNPENWTGHTGCVILAPHLQELTKKELGLPHYDDATERQRKDGMCWKSEDEKYNDGSAFKITCRDERGVVVTIISDNYYGYCKKEVKTMISYSANLYGSAEEEHAGGAIAFRSYNLGEKAYLDERLPSNGLTFNQFTEIFSDVITLKPEGYAVDNRKSELVYVPDDAVFEMNKQTICWTKDGETQNIKLLPYKVYIYPNGYKIEMKKRIDGTRWHLVGTHAEGTVLHKPCTVSGGGKSEISKSISDAMIQGSYIVGDLAEDLAKVDEIMTYDFSTRFNKPADYSVNPPRHILSSSRSLGSVIKLLTPSDEYTDEYNTWLTSLPQRIKVLIYVIKGRYSDEWDSEWRSYFSVDQINGQPGNELKYKNEKLTSNYLRVGHDIDGGWRIFLTRQDFEPSAKVQTEDDISSSMIVPASALNDLNAEYHNPSVKMLTNCEARLFQRPDDCIIKGYDKQGEKDLSTPNTFVSNFEPLNRAQVQSIKDDAIGFELYTQPVKDLINRFLESSKPEYCVIPSEPRLVNGAPSKNPRYLQVRPDITEPLGKFVAEMSTRIFRKVPMNKPLHMPVNAVLPGRRNNPADEANNVPPLAVYNPIHYQELPELFIDFICSVTGKSPSTTGFGSEGALTKGPFNNLLPSSDLNNAFLSYILTGYDGFSSAAGYVGPKFKVDHDVSLLIPEIWCRMSVEERDPQFLIKSGCLEKVEDFEYNGKKVEAGLLGYRITKKFVTRYLGRIFSKPDSVFCDEMLKPETQNMEMFVASIDNLSVTQRRVAEGLLGDGTVDCLCPPLKGLVHTMVHGTYKGMKRTDAKFRQMFTPEEVLKSGWYKARLVAKQQKDVALWTKNVNYIEDILARQTYAAAAERLDLASRLEAAQNELARVSSVAYLESLHGTLGVDTMKPIAD
ncbi:MAG: hypothetical protein ACK5JS_05795 [Mangrovibacterium sp.]